MAREKQRIQRDRLKKDYNTTKHNSVEANGPKANCTAGRKTLNSSQEAIQV